VVRRIILIRVQSIRWGLFPFVLVLLWQGTTGASLHLESDALNNSGIAAGQDTTGFQQPFSSGKLSRRAKAAQRRSAMMMSQATVVDTSRAVLEYIRSLPRDSSARLAQLMYVRKDKPAVDWVYHKPFSLYLPDPPAVKYQVTLDSTRWIYHLHRTVGGHDTRIPLDLPLDAYVALRMKETIRKNWEAMAQFYELQGETKTGLGELFGKVTKIEIPVPKNPIFSIFGPNIIRLNINGGVDIHGAFRNTKSDQYTASPLGQNRNEPDFNQQVQVNVKGVIGDKLNIDADWNTQRTFEYENQLHVKYQGYEDEIVQSIEAGNVSLSTNSSFISSSQALFGLKGRFQFGPLNLTTIATQKKGQIKELTVSGGAQATPFEKQITQYSTDHYFIDTAYIGQYENIFFRPQPLVDPRLQIRDIEVWVSRVGAPDPSRERNVVAFMSKERVDAIMQDPVLLDSVRHASFSSTGDGEIEAGSFVMLTQNTDYNVDLNAGIISLIRSIPSDQAIAVAYSVTGPDNQPRYIGQFGSRTRNDSANLVMKLVRPKNLGPQMKTAWRLMLKNRYPLGGTGIKQDGFELYIEFQPPGQPALREVLPQNIGLLEMFGLDRYTGTNTGIQPDKVFDYSPGITIDENRGELIFPTVEPFRDTTILNMLRDLAQFTPEAAKAAADSFSFNAVYDTTYNGATNDQHNRFYLRGFIKPATASTYQLGFNIVEGSVQVIVDGQTATPGSDYTVDYITGQVVIKNQAFLVPGKNLQIKYEANDLFQLASKSLTGARAELSLGPNTTIGATIMNLNQQSLSDKVRLGEEPISNTIMGVDGGTSFDAPWLTNALNLLPGVKSIVPSQISLRGEAAYMKPNPNTRSSPIPQDGGKGVAYIDDFEGSRQMIPLGIIFTQWKDASPPWYIPNLDTLQPGGADGKSIPTSDNYIVDGSILADTAKIQYKAKASWFNIIPSDVLVGNVWGYIPGTTTPRKSVAQGEDQVTVLNFYFKPAERGEFNYSTNLENTIGLDNPDAASHTKAWAGIQQDIGTTSNDLIDQNIGFIELWVNVVQCKDSAKLNIDLGYISERVIPSPAPAPLRQGFHTEDGLDGGQPRGVLNPAYDWGLDCEADVAERIDPKIKPFLDHYASTHPEYNSDPSGDDYVGPPGTVRALNDATVAEAYNKVNGTEGNGSQSNGSIAGNFPDTEDLNNNGVLDRINSYYEYEIPLDTLSPGFQSFVTGGGGTGWYQIRIPLSDYTRRIGDPTLSNVEGMRLWVTGAEQPVLFRITEFNLVGNQWEKLTKTDTSYDVSVVNYEDNPSYVSPPGVFRQKDLTRPDQNILGNEQSMSLIVKHLAKGQSVEAVRRFNTRPLDMFNYRTMKMFVHGEIGEPIDSALKGYQTFQFKDTSQYDAEMFIRFGDDTLNYYEYREPVHPGWIGNDVQINFGDLTAIKAQRDTTNGIFMSPEVDVPGGPPGAKYRVVGNPRLDRILAIYIGIENPKGIKSVVHDSLQGELWVNELRLTDVDDTPGWAYRFDSSIKLADIGTIAFSYSKRDPFFHGLEDHFGSRSTSQSWNLSSNFAFERLLPESWAGSSLGFSYTHTEAMNMPRYMPGTDILVDKIAADTSAVTRKLYPNAAEVRARSEDLSVTDTYAAPNIKLNIPIQSWLVTETVNKMSFGYSYTNSYSHSPTVQFSDSWNWNANFRYATQFNVNNYVKPFSSLGNFFLFGLWKDLKFYYTPRQFNMGATLTRSQNHSQTRDQLLENPVIRNLASTRTMGFGWQFFDGGFLNLGIDYQVNVSSSLVHLETNKYGHQRGFIDILSDMFFSDRLIDFGKDLNYGQSINANTKIVVPQVLMLDKIFTPNFRYSVLYNWQNNIQAPQLGRSAGWSSSPSLSLDVNVKPLADKIWSPTSATPAPPPAKSPADTGTAKKSMSVSQTLDQITRTLFKTPFFDFERINISFTQQNTSQNSGVFGSGNGSGNLFGHVPFLQPSSPGDGPSLLYQLGFASDPNGEVVLGTKGAFPFITGKTNPGIRAPDGSLTDIFSQNNRITVTTSRPLWEGAQIQLNWNLGWSYNQNKSIQTDQNGIVRDSLTVRSVSGDMDRSFMTFPPVLMFKFFKTSLDNVNEKYLALQAADPDNAQSTNQEKLSQAFESGLEALPWLTKLLQGLAPRANWSLHWGGLEKFSLFNSFASQVSLDHAYTSSFRRRWSLQSGGEEVTESESVTYGFSPLVGLNITFKPLAKGNLSATVRYSTTQNYDLSPSIQNVMGSSGTDILISGTFSRQGFEIPFFGLSLSNDIDISFNYTLSKTARRLFDFQNYTPDGTPMEGSTRTTIEPRIRYTLSARVTASLYYRFTKLTPDAGGSKIPGSTINEGGLDVHVAIQ
jgi:cell surface protein SprA